MHRTHQPDADDDFIALTETSRILAVSTRTVYRYEEQGLLTPMRTPMGHRRFSRKQVTELRDSWSAPPAAPTAAAS